MTPSRLALLLLLRQRTYVVARTYRIEWAVTAREIVRDVIAAIGSHASVDDVHSYGLDVLGVQWSRGEVLDEMRDLLASGGLRSGTDSRPDPSRSSESWSTGWVA